MDISVPSLKDFKHGIETKMTVAADHLALQHRWVDQQCSARPLFAAKMGEHTAQMGTGYPPELMRMWPISTRVNKPDHDDPAILEPLQETEPGLP